jgi:hypothetical protein
VNRLFKADDKIPDPCDDEIGRLISFITLKTAQTLKKKQLVSELGELLDSVGYITFGGDTKDYHLPRVGDSCLYEVPDNRKGNLKPFRGKRIRIICVGSGTYSQRQLRAGVYQGPSPTTV